MNAGFDTVLHYTLYNVCETLVVYTYLSTPTISRKKKGDKGNNPKLAFGGKIKRK